MTEHITKQPGTALITGGSRGLGLALARVLAHAGWTLILDARGAAALAAVHSELTKLTNVTTLAGDITDSTHRQQLAQAVAAAGGLDVLVNNASVLGPSPQPTLLEYPLEVLEQVYRTNVIAPLALIQTLRPYFKSKTRVLNITSDAGVEAYEGWGGYGSSKAALEQLSHILAAENPEWRVYWVDPGDMRTQMHQEAFPGEDISDRPLPETSVPGLLPLIWGELPSGRYAARNLLPEANTEKAEKPAADTVKELRVALTVSDFEQAAKLYRDGLGLQVITEWQREDGRGMILKGGQATIELVDQTQAEIIDKVEVGQRVSGPVRLAFEVADVVKLSATLGKLGAKTLTQPVHTPWGDFNQRLQTGDGLQMTLFQTLSATNPSSEEQSQDGD